MLSARQDDFYRRHMYSNFGDAGAAVKGLVDEFQRQSASSQNINTIEDMQVGLSEACLMAYSMHAAIAKVSYSTFQCNTPGYILGDIS